VTERPEEPTEEESVAEAADPSSEPAEAEEPEVPAEPSLEQQLAERTADLQRLQAEYVNYKRRVDRDRDTARKVGIESVLKDLLSVLDDLRSAREHGELTGAFKAVGDDVERITAKHGLTSFGTKGDAFDPHIHEALLHAHADGIDGPTCVEILQPGYQVGDRILRPARVAVAEPDPEASQQVQGDQQSVDEPESVEQEQ
jgi:molecular chaperone GrpE